MITSAKRIVKTSAFPCAAERKLRSSSSTTGKPSACARTARMCHRHASHDTAFAEGRRDAGATLWAIALSCFAGCGSLVKISKYLSYHLRHRPDLLGLELAEGKWVEVDKSIAAARKNKFPFDLSEFKTVVEQSDKQRFAFDSTGKLI